MGAGQPGQRPGAGDGPDPLDPGQRAPRRARAGQPAGHEGGGEAANGPPPIWWWPNPVIRAWAASCAAPTWAGPSRPTPTRNGKTSTWCAWPMARWRRTPSRPRRSCTSRTRWPRPAWTARPALAVRSACGCCARKRAQDAGRVRRALRRAGNRRTGPALHQHGKRAVADAHGGTMSGAGFYTTLCHMLNTLVGNLNVEGGLVLDAGPFRLARSALQHRRLRQPRHAQGRGPVAQSLSLREVENSSARRRRASRPIRPPRLVSGHRRTQLGNAGLGAGGLPPRKVWFNHEQSGLRHRGLSPGLADKLRIRARCRWPSRSIPSSARPARWPTTSCRTP